MPHQEDSTNKASQRDKSKAPTVSRWQAQKAKAEQCYATCKRYVTRAILWMRNIRTFIAEKWRWWNHDRVVAAFTIIIAVTTIVYAKFSYLQFRTMERQLGLSERPWIKVSVGDAAPSSGPSEKTVLITLPLHLINTGKTPAKYIRADFYIEHVRNGSDALLNKSTPFWYINAGVVFPNDSIDQPGSSILFQSDWQDFTEGRSFLVVYSHVTYKDVFQTEHWTDYCRTLVAKTGPYTSWKCGAYNNTDDN